MTSEMLSSVLNNSKLVAKRISPVQFSFYRGILRRVGKCVDSFNGPANCFN